MAAGSGRVTSFTRSYSLWIFTFTLMLALRSGEGNDRACVARGFELTMPSYINQVLEHNDVNPRRRRTTDRA